MVMNREFENGFIIEYFNKAFKNSGLNVNIINSIFVTGIYYLIIHKKISTFSSVDYNKEETKEQMKQTVRDMVERLYP